MNLTAVSTSSAPIHASTLTTSNLIAITQNIWHTSWFWCGWYPSRLRIRRISIESNGLETGSRASASNVSIRHQSSPVPIHFLRDKNNALNEPHIFWAVGEQKYFNTYPSSNRFQFQRTKTGEEAIYGTFINSNSCAKKGFSFFSVFPTKWTIAQHEWNIFYRKSVLISSAMRKNITCAIYNVISGRFSQWTKISTSVLVFTVAYN